MLLEYIQFLTAHKGNKDLAPRIAGQRNFFDQKIIINFISK